MNIDEIIEFMGSCGLRYTRSQLLKMADYLCAMMEDSRLFMVYDGIGTPVALVAFSICDDCVPYYNKSIWEYLTHEILGETVYIEKIVARKFNQEIRNIIERKITEVYPNVRYGVWFRPTLANDRNVNYDIKEKRHVPDQNFN